MFNPFKLLPLLLAGVTLVAQETSFDTLREEGRW